MPRPRGRVRIYTDSLSQRVVRHVTQAEALTLVDQSPCYEFIDPENPEAGVTVKTEVTPMRPPIAITITLSELCINAGVNFASDLRAEEVRQKIAHYNDDDVKREVMASYCPWPREQFFALPSPPSKAIQERAVLDEDQRAYWNHRLGHGGIKIQT